MTRRADARFFRVGGAPGFTLVELLVVVVLLGIAGSLAMLAAGDGSAQDLDLAAMQIEDTVERARSLASSRRVAHGVVFDLDGDRFAVVDETGEAVLDPITRKPFIVDFARPDQPDRIDITAADFGDADTTALFNAQGVPLAGGTVTLQRNGLSRTLTFDPATGRMQ